MSTQRTPDPSKVTKHSKLLAWVLRHGAGRRGLTMNEAGWVSVEELMTHLSLSYQDIELVTTHNNKSRYELHNGMIRASQGHSLEEMPVTQKALEDSWSKYRGRGSIWHGTRLGVIDSIRSEGILRGGRSHVHLASSIDSKVGKRVQITVLIEVSQTQLRKAGYDIFVSANGVILTRYVPETCIINMWELKNGERYLL